MFKNGLYNGAQIENSSHNDNDTTQKKILLLFLKSTIMKLFSIFFYSFYQVAKTPIYGRMNIGSVSVDSLLSQFIIIQV